jgi:hypothetical protein
MGLWWVIVFRLPPLDNQFGESTPQYIAVVASSLLALGVSVTLAARADAGRTLGGVVLEPKSRVLAD